ncbi:MAG: cytochrome c oxidase assembly protein [Cyanobacteria bacterium RYN_339]|nr:cytochrome c oxidase assembly protein [Cyanobacteria bacterium RYN_339]
MDNDLALRNRRTTRLVLGVMTVMAILPWVYAPLYRKVCGALGIPVAAANPFDVVLKTAKQGIGRDRAGHQQSLVNFMGVSGELPIDITPLTRRAWVKTGDTYAVTYRLTNLSNHDLDYKAMHMVIPQPNESFELIKCFCDEHRVIKAHVTEEWPLTFRLVKPVVGDVGLTVNYTIFNFDHSQNKARAGTEPIGAPTVKIGAR